MGALYDKETPDFPVARINFSLMETDSSKYTKKKWWGEFNSSEKLRHLGDFLIGFDDSRKGVCIVMANTEATSKATKIWYYRFNGRGALGKKR